MRPYDFLVGNTYFTILDRSPGSDSDNGVYDPQVDEIQINGRSLDLNNPEHNFTFRYVSQTLGITYPESYTSHQKMELFNHFLREHRLSYAQNIFQRRDTAREAARMGNCSLSFRQFTAANRTAGFNVAESTLFPLVAPQILISLQTFFSPNAVSGNPIQACYGEDNQNYINWLNTPPPPVQQTRPASAPSEPTGSQVFGRYGSGAGRDLQGRLPQLGSGIRSRPPVIGPDELDL